MRTRSFFPLIGHAKKTKKERVDRGEEGAFAREMMPIRRDMEIHLRYRDNDQETNSTQKLTRVQNLNQSPIKQSASSFLVASSSFCRGQT